METVSFNPDEVLALLPLIEASVSQTCHKECLTDEVAWTTVACLAIAKLSRLKQTIVDDESSSELKLAS